MARGQQDADDDHHDAGRTVDPDAVLAVRTGALEQPRGEQATEQKRHAESEAIDEQQQRPTRAALRCGIEQDRSHHGADAWRPADRKDDTGEARTGQRGRARFQFEASTTANQLLSKAEQREAHQDHEDATNDLDRTAIVRHERAEIADTQTVERKHDRKAADEDTRGNHHAAPVRADLLVRHTRDVRQIHRYERPHTGR